MNANLTNYTNFENGFSSNNEYKNPTITKQTVTKSPIYQKVKVNKPIALPLAFKNTQYVNKNNDYKVQNYINYNNNLISSTTITQNK